VLLLTLEERKAFLYIIQNRNLTYLAYKVSRKKIWGNQRERFNVRIANNGPVEKTDFLRIINERCKNLKKTNLQDYSRDIV